jgi:5-methylcytosine-specific restriction enzyme A
MPTKSPHFCLHPGCRTLTVDAYCMEHAPLHQYTDNRENATARGYDNRWRKFSRRYLAMPEHQFCVLHISPACRGLAECVDHIVPLQGPNDPRKYDIKNLQPACLPCNTAKGRKETRGAWVYGDAQEGRG